MQLWRLGGIFACGLYFLYCASRPAQWHFIDNANLIFHEAGHVIFSLFGQFVAIAMGSGFQILVPLSIALYFFYTRQDLSASFALMWTGESIANVSVYASDASVMRLPLLGGDGVIHDWNYLLNATQLLGAAQVIGGALLALGLSCTIAALLAGVFVAVREAQSPARGGGERLFS